jgi:hypothetical protein
MMNVPALMLTQLTISKFSVVVDATQTETEKGEQGNDRIMAM